MNTAEVNFFQQQTILESLVYRRVLVLCSIYFESSFKKVVLRNLTRKILDHLFSVVTLHTYLNVTALLLGTPLIPLGKCSASAWWDSTGHSKSLSFVERSMAPVEHSVGLVV